MPEPASRSPGVGLRALLVLPILAAWVALLVVPGLAPAWLLRSLVARFAPLGFLAVFAFPDRGLRTTRVLLVATPALLLGAAAALVALGWRARDGALPGPSDVLLPTLAVALGVLLALAWRRGPFALLLLPLKLAFLALVAFVLATVLAFSQAQREPALRTTVPVTAAEERQLVALLQGMDPWTLPPEEVRTVRIEQPQVDRLAAWLLPRVVSPERARVAIVLPAEATVEVRASLPLAFGRWLNTSASGRVHVDRGRFELGQLRLRFGRSAMPAALTDALAPPLAAAIRAERPLRPLLAAIREAHVEPGALVVDYGRADSPRGPIGELFQGRPAPTPRPMLERPPGKPARR